MAITTLTVGAGSLTIGADTELTVFSSQATSVRLVPSVDQGDAIHVLSGESVAGDRTESFTLEGTLLQDLGATTSTTEWLYEHRGETHAFEFVPSTAKGKAIVGSLVNTKVTSDFTFTVVGAPAITTVV